MKDQTQLKSKVAVLEEWRSSDSPYVHEDDIYGAMEEYAAQFKDNSSVGVKSAIEVLCEFTGKEATYLHDKNRIIMAMEAYHAQYAPSSDKTVQPMKNSKDIVFGPGNDNYGQNKPRSLHPFNEMNFTEFQVQLRCCLIIKDGFDNEWMHDFYSDFREDYDAGRYPTVKEWAEFFFQEVTLETHSYCLVSSLSDKSVEVEEAKTSHVHLECPNCGSDVEQAEAISRLREENTRLKCSLTEIAAGYDCHEDYLRMLAKEALKTKE